MRGSEKLKICRGSKKRIPDMKCLWLEVFPEDTDFVHVFFEKFYKPSKALLRYDGGKLVSMLFWLDVKAKYGRKTLKGAYLYGVATSKYERHAGHFSHLHDEFVRIISEKKYDFITAIPANEQLFAFYKKFGYNSFFKRCEYSVSTLDFDQLSHEEAWERRFEAYKKSRQGLVFLESREAFLETVKEHRFLGFEGGYFAFVENDGKYVLYDVCDPEKCAPPYTLVRYSRSAVLYDVNSIFDEDFSERERPVLNYLLS